MDKQKSLGAARAGEHVEWRDLETKERGNGVGKRKLPEAGCFPQTRKSSPVNSFLGRI